MMVRDVPTSHLAAISCWDCPGLSLHEGLSVSVYSPQLCRVSNSVLNRSHFSIGTSTYTYSYMDIYGIARKFGEDFNLVVWRTVKNRQIKFSPN